MSVATYLANLTSYSALDMATPYKPRFGKEANLSRLKTIGARALVHIETDTKKLDTRLRKGGCAATARIPRRTASTTLQRTRWWEAGT